MLVAYWLIPPPNIQRTTPAKDEIDYGTKRKIEIIFDRPVSRSSLQKTISPEVPGVWIFEDAFYTTHFYRKVTFYPTQSLTPDTTFTITLSNIKNPLKISKPYSYSYSFKTQPSPRVLDVMPANNTKDVAISTPITIALTEANDGVSSFDFALNPSHPMTTKLDSKKKVYTLSPNTPFKQGTTYTFTVKRTDLIYNLPTNTIIERGNTLQEYQGTFITKEAPGIVEFSPSESNVLPTSPVTVMFSEPMDRSSVEKNFSITPHVQGKFFWKDDQTMAFTPKTLAFEKTYSVKIAKDTKAKHSGFLEEEVVQTFTTIGRVKVAQFSPDDGWSAVGVNNQIKNTFD